MRHFEYNYYKNAVAITICVPKHEYRLEEYVVTYRLLILIFANKLRPNPLFFIQITFIFFIQAEQVYLICTRNLQSNFLERAKFTKYIIFTMDYNSTGVITMFQYLREGVGV
jgi:hypothetical protein